MSKAGLEMLTKSTALELASKKLTNIGPEISHHFVTHEAARVDNDVKLQIQNKANKVTDERKIEDCWYETRICGRVHRQFSQAAVKNNIRSHKSP